jgi:hypothetical protein
MKVRNKTSAEAEAASNYPLRRLHGAEFDRCRQRRTTGSRTFLRLVSAAGSELAGALVAIAR